MTYRGSKKTFMFAVFLYIFALALQSQIKAENPKWLLSQTHEEKARQHNLETSNLRDLANNFKDQGRYAEAEPLFRRLLEISKNTFGPRHINTSASLYNLADILIRQANYAEAEPLLLSSLEISKNNFGLDHADTALTLNNLAVLYEAQGRYVEAEPLFDLTLSIYEKIFGAEHPYTATGLNNLAGLYETQSRYAEAEQLYQRALSIRKKVLNPDHFLTAQSFNNLAFLFYKRGRFFEAEPLYRLALAIYEKALGSDHPEIAGNLINLGALLQNQGNFFEAEQLFNRALTIFKNSLGLDHPLTAQISNNLAVLYEAQKRYTEAEKLYKYTLETYNKILGSEHILLSPTLNNLAGVYRNQGRFDESEQLYRRALSVIEKALGAEHPEVALTLNNLGIFYRNQDRYSDADQSFQLGIAILEKAFGLDHPNVALSLENMSLFLIEYSHFLKALAPARRAFRVRRALALREAASNHEDARERLGSATGKAAVIFARAAFKTARLGGGPDANDAPEALRTEAFMAAQEIRQSGAAQAIARGAALIAADKQELGLGLLVRSWERSLAERATLDKQFMQAASATGLDAPAKRNSLAQRRTELDQAITQAENELKIRYPVFFDLINPDPVSIADLQARTGEKAALLRDDEALIFVTPGDQENDAISSGLVFAVTKEGAAWSEVSLPYDELATRIDRLRANLDRGNRSPKTGVSEQIAGGALGYDRGSAKAIHDALFGDSKIAALITSKPNWLIAPQGKLLSLPFAALVTQTPDGDDADPTTLRHTAWLGMERNLSILPSVSSLRTLRVLDRAAPTGDRDPFFGLGDPDFQGQTGTRSGDQIAQTPQSLGPMPAYFRDAGANIAAIRGLSRLPETAAEIKAIAESLGARSDSYLLGSAAREAALRDRDRDGRLARARIIVFATHGLIQGDLARTLAEPALALTPPPRLEALDSNDDGLLTATEIARLTLTAEWVILSACNTAAGEKESADGLTGLARAFFYAGAQSLLVSHWRVRDDAAAALTKRAVALSSDPDPKRKMSRPQALRESMRELMNDTSQDASGASFAHPAAWAPFALVGAD